MSSGEAWAKATEWERQWWGTCANTLGEEVKQTLYAERMGLRFFHDGCGPYNIDLQGRSVLDIGGGPCSLLLKCVNGGQSSVADPCEYPSWVRQRYEAAGICWLRVTGEELTVEKVFGEAWIYNVLQHTRDPAKIVENARRSARLVRAFEWIDTVVNEGHPHALTCELLDQWFGGQGKVEQVNERGCVGRCWYGVFKGERYGE